MSAMALDIVCDLARRGGLGRIATCAGDGRQSDSEHMRSLQCAGRDWIALNVNSPINWVTLMCWSSMVGVRESAPGASKLKTMRTRTESCEICSLSPFIGRRRSLFAVVL